MKYNSLFILMLCIFSYGNASYGSSADDHFEKRAEKFHGDGRFQQAVDILSKEAERLSTKGYLTLAASYSELKQYDNEVRILNILSTKEPKNYQWHMLIGQSYLKKSRSLTDPEAKRAEETKSVQTFRSTIRANAKFKPAYDQLLEIFLEKNEHHEARELLMEALREFGDRPQWLNKLCELQANDGFLAQAEETCNRAIRRSPGFPDNYVFLSQSLLDQNETDKAQKIARHIGDKFPKSEFAQWGAGKVYLIAKNYEAAIKFFGNAVHTDENSYRSHFGLADALFDSGDQAGALGHYRKACQLAAQQPPATRTQLSQAVHVRSAEARIKGNDSLGQEYRNIAETCS